MTARILFTSLDLEYPPAGGSQLRVANSAKALSRVSDLFIVSRTGKAQMGDDAAAAFFSSLAREFRFAPSCHMHSANRYIRKAQRIIGGITGRDTARDAAFLLRCIDEWKIDIVWVGFGNISFPLIKALRRARPQLKMVCDTDSIWSRFILRELPYIKNPLRYALISRRGRAKEEEERAWVEMCDVTTGVSEVDCDYYRAFASKKDRVRLFSNVIDLADYAGIPPAPTNFHKPCIFLAGKFGHANSPMDRAARWMLDEVMPIIRQTMPDMHFYIVGSGSDKTLGHETNANVTVTGKLPSVLPYLCHGDVSVVPLMFESGTRFKILEAAACRIPIVSTTLGAEGLPVRDGEHLLIADTPEAFAKAVLRLVQDKAYGLKLAENCRAMVHGQFSVDALEKEARQILDYLRG